MKQRLTKIKIVISAQSYTGNKKKMEEMIFEPPFQIISADLAKLSKELLTVIKKYEIN